MKKIDVSCDECQLDCQIRFSEKKAEISYCPFCGEEITLAETEDEPLITNFEDMDEFESRFESAKKKGSSIEDLEDEDLDDDFYGDDEEE